MASSEKVQNEKKAKLEADISRALAPLFRDYLRQYNRAILTKTALPSQLEIRARLEEILSRHYPRVQDQFRNEAFTGFDPVDGDFDAVVSFEILLAKWIAQQVPLKAKIITDTNTAQGERNKEKARQFLIEKGDPFTNADLALVATALLARDFHQRRTQTIPNMETQTPAEATKFLKTQAADKIFLITKTWNTNLDGKERDTHHQAHHQQRPKDAPFVVGGESLMYPKDPWGAFRETVNCRCWMTSTTQEL